MKIPQLGLGTWKADKGVVGESLIKAFGVGYKLVDCAEFYGNEKEIGEMGIKPYLETHKREDLIICSKVWSNHLTDIRKACINSIENLQCKYLDIYFIHWPVVLKPTCGGFPKSSEDFLDIDLVEIYKQMESLVDEGLIKSIGLSNFTISQMDRIIKNCRIKPVMEQVELNVYFQNEKIREYCNKNNIIVEAYRPIGGNHPDEKKCIEDEVVVELSKKYNKTPAQICLKWLNQNNILAIPKSTNANRLQQNIDIFDFTISEEDMEKLKQRDTHIRTCFMEDFWNGKTQQEFWED